MAHFVMRNSYRKGAFEAFRKAFIRGRNRPEHSKTIFEIVFNRGRMTEQFAKSFSILSPGACQHNPQSSKEYDCIEFQRPFVNIFQIQIHPVIERYLIPTRHDLPETGHARFHGQPPSLPHIIFGNLIGKRRSWTDETHLASDHVDQLGQFVQTCFSQKMSDIGNNT